MNQKPLIVISNDDGIQAKGIRCLVEIASELAEVIVVAPNSPQSGKGHAITMDQPLEVYESTLFGEQIRAYECSGTPADCVKLAKRYIPKNRNIDLVLSGINHGSNASISVIYSGTMSAAIEAAVEGIPAIGFSLCDYDHSADMKHYYPFISKIIQNALKYKMLDTMALNVNIPACAKDEIKGIKVVRQAKGVWKENFDERVNPYGKKYLWLTGEFENQDEGAEDTDIWALENKYISIVPCKFDLTEQKHAKWLEGNWDLK